MGAENSFGPVRSLPSGSPGLAAATASLRLSQGQSADFRHHDEDGRPVLLVVGTLEPSRRCSTQHET